MGRPQTAPPVSEFGEHLNWCPPRVAGAVTAESDRYGPTVSAVFVANDHMALGLIKALHEAGLRVPQDVSVVGFDDIPEAEYLLPPLTTVRQDFAELGRRGVEVLARVISGDTLLDSAPMRPELVVRASTAPVPV